jgi:hypothetical protein
MMILRLRPVAMGKPSQKKKLRKRARKAAKHKLGNAVEKNGHHEREKRAKKK